MHNKEFLKYCHSFSNFCSGPEQRSYSIINSENKKKDILAKMEKLRERKQFYEDNIEYNERILHEDFDFKFDIN